MNTKGVYNNLLTPAMYNSIEEYTMDYFIGGYHVYNSKKEIQGYSNIMITSVFTNFGSYAWTVQLIRSTFSGHTFKAEQLPVAVWRMMEPFGSSTSFSYLKRAILVISTLSTLQTLPTSLCNMRTTYRKYFNV